MYDLATVANIARRAGFTADELHLATAAAWVTSGGNPDYRHDYPIPGTGRLRGLWGLDIDRWPEYAAADLLHGPTAAEAAHELTRATGDLSWCGAVRAGAHRAFLPSAATACTDVYHRQPVAARVGAVGVADPLREFRHSMARTRLAVSYIRRSTRR